MNVARASFKITIHLDEIRNIYAIYQVLFIILIIYIIDNRIDIYKKNYSMN